MTTETALADALSVIAENGKATAEAVQTLADTLRSMASDPDEQSAETSVGWRYLRADECGPATN